MIITTKFDIGDSVTISEIGLVARIVQIIQDGSNLYYKCQYWMEGKIFSVDLDENELEKAHGDFKKKCGING